MNPILKGFDRSLYSYLGHFAKPSILAAGHNTDPTRIFSDSAMPSAKLEDRALVQPLPHMMIKMPGFNMMQPGANNNEKLPLIK